jgi:hypothetical protein
VARYAELAKRAEADDAEYAAGRKAAYHVTRSDAPEYENHGAHCPQKRAKVGRAPRPVINEKGEWFESYQAAAVAYGTHRASISCAIRKKCRAAGVKWFPVAQPAA